MRIVISNIFAGDKLQATYGLNMPVLEEILNFIGVIH
jgi:hypothetical protein